MSKHQKEYVQKNKEVIAKRRKAWRKKNKEMIAKKEKEWRENNKEKCAKWKKEYYENNYDKIAEAGKIYCEKNKEIIAQKQKEYAKNNKDIKSEYAKKYYVENQVVIKEKNKEYIKNNKEEIARKDKIYRDTNKEKIADMRRGYRIRSHGQRNEHSRYKYKTDICYRLLVSLRSRIGKVIRGENKSVSTIELLGCSLEELKIYLTDLMVDGMAWDNYGKDGWHIDHIIPCKYYGLTNVEEQKKCFNYKNLQPLWAKDNLSKGAKHSINKG